MVLQDRYEHTILLIGPVSCRFCGSLISRTTKPTQTPDYVPEKRRSIPAKYRYQSYSLQSYAKSRSLSLSLFLPTSPSSCRFLSRNSGLKYTRIFCFGILSLPGRFAALKQRIKQTTRTSFIRISVIIAISRSSSRSREQKNISPR